jgi:membrane protein YdbS with pleckstrin-like domain
MSAGSIDYGALGIEKSRTSRSVLVDRPDKRMMRVRYLAPVLILCIGAIIYELPIGDLKVVFLPLTWLFAMAVVYSVTMHEILARAVYTVTAEYIESESGIVGKKVRTIPISYVRDVTYGQNFLQAMLEISDITVSATNGDKIVLRDIADGSRKRDLISKLVLSKCAAPQRVG